MSKHNNHLLQSWDYTHQFHAKMIKETQGSFHGNESHVLHFSEIAA